MDLRSLYLKHFRLYDEVFFEFCPGINVLYGSNAQGKTTILEAIHFLITGRSFRTTQIADLIQEGAEAFFLEAIFFKHGIEQRLRIWSNGKQRKIIYNNTVCHSTANLLGLLQGVIMTQDDVSLIKGGPQVRRHFLDLQIAQIDPLYVHHLTRYQKAMRQRNCLLRNKNLHTIENWEQEMSNAAVYIAQQRIKTSDDLAGICKRLHQSLTGEKKELGLLYKMNVPQFVDLSASKQHYQDLLKQHRHREMMQGTTLHGPHKDDLTISIGNQEARFFASEGQQRSCVSVLYSAMWERLNQLAGDSPLMLIDDIGVSLDESRKRNLFQHLGNLGQVFVTTTEELDIKDAAHLRIKR